MALYNVHLAGPSRKLNIYQKLGFQSTWVGQYINSSAVTSQFFKKKIFFEIFEINLWPVNTRKISDKVH